MTMKMRHAREIRAGIRLARRCYPYDRLPESAPDTHKLMTRGYDHEWARQERLRDRRAFPNLDFGLLDAFRVAFPSRETRQFYLRQISSAIRDKK